MQLYFVRHGESDANRLQVISNRHDCYGLTPRGQQQAQALAEKLKPVPIAAIFTSPLCRAVETAAILSQALGPPYQITDALREYDCGILEGKSDPASWQLHQEIAEDWRLRQNWQRRPDQGESFLDIKNRFLPLITSLIEDPYLAHVPILLVGHGGLFQLMLPLVLANIDGPFVTHHPIAHTDCIMAELQPHGLHCRQWGELHLR